MFSVYSQNALAHTAVSIDNMVTVFKLGHIENALLFIFLIVSGNVTLSTVSLLLNAFSPISVTIYPSSFSGNTISFASIPTYPSP